ncbi:MAG: hypothetical protein IKI87_01080 [Clostridiales bacterium]|nr:hypothetical protein [Clostridiales bacterium]
MKKLIRVLSLSLITSMILPLSACSKSGKFRIPEEDELSSFLEDKLEAEETDEDTLSLDDWNEGFYFTSDEYNSPTKYKVALKDSGPVMMIGQKISSMGLFFNTYKVLNKTGGGWKNFGADSELCYLKYDEDLSKGKTIETSKGQAKKQELTQFLSSVMVFTFEDEDGAEDCFEWMIEKSIEDHIDNYETVLTKYEKTPKLLKSNYGYLYDEDAELADREIYDLDDLPKDVYELDKKNHTGHFSFHADDKWVQVGDIYRTEKTPEYTTFLQQSMDYSLLLQDNRIMIVYHLDVYTMYGWTDVYYDEWPDYEFETDEAIEAIYKKFGIKDPKKIKIEDDLATELNYISCLRGNNSITLDLPEIYRTSDSDTKSKKSRKDS